MAQLLNSTWTEKREEKKEYDGGESIKFENKNGDVLVYTPKEAKYVLQEYINEELNLFADDVVKTNKIVMEQRINFKLKQLEISLLQHIDEKLMKITEKMLELTIERKINEEVEKRLEEKLKKIKKSL